MNLHQPLTVLPGVGPKSAEKFAKLGLETLQDLLLYFPFRYEDFKSKNVLDLEDGEKAVVSGQVVTRPMSSITATNATACALPSSREKSLWQLISLTSLIWRTRLK